MVTIKVKKRFPLKADFRLHAVTIRVKKRIHMEGKMLKMSNI